MPTPSAPRPMRIDTPRIVKPTIVSISVSSPKAYRSKNSVLLARVVSWRQVHDREHHENEGLQRDTTDVEDRPRHVEQQGPETAHGHPDQPGPELQIHAEEEQRDQNEDELARVHVAPEPQRQRQ